MSWRLPRDWPLSEPCRACLGRVYTAWDRTEPTRISYYHRRHTEVKRDPDRAVCERAEIGATPDRVAYNRTALSLYTDTWVASNVPWTLLHILRSSTELTVAPRYPRQQTEVTWTDGPCHARRWPLIVSPYTRDRLLKKGAYWRCGRSYGLRLQHDMRDSRARVRLSFMRATAP